MAERIESDRNNLQVAHELALDKYKDDLKNTNEGPSIDPAWENSGSLKSKNKRSLPFFAAELNLK